MRVRINLYSPKHPPMKNNPDLTGLDDIKTLVDAFYGAIREDELLGPVFNNKIEDRWPQHLDKMYRFWQTVLFTEHTYFGSPFPPHFELPVEKKHFDRWLQLFRQTVDGHYSGAKADEAKWRAEKMAEMFQFKIAHFKNMRSKPL